MKIDLEEAPPFFKVSDTHYAATWLLHPDAPQVEPPVAIIERMKKFPGSRYYEGTEGGDLLMAEKLLEIKNLKAIFQSR